MDLNKTMNIFLILSFFIVIITCFGPDNTCTFHIGGKVFSMIALAKQQPYQFQLEKDHKSILWNFCQPVTYSKCSSVTAYSLLVEKHYVESTNQTQYQCNPYSSSASMKFYDAYYTKDRINNYLTIKLFTQNNRNTSIQKYTEMRIKCSSEQDNFKTQSVSIDENVLFITGQSSSGCPVFQISSLWYALQENSIIFGLILLVVGAYSLFYGRSMLVVTLFIAGYFISFVILGAIFTAFIGPNTSSIAIYFSLIFILFASTLFAYGITKIINVSIFLIGAWLGFIVGALVNSIFASIFHIYSVWSLVVFEILFIIPIGLLTFKFANQVIICSTSLTGSYLIIRPISWIFGGFPNEFILQQLYQTGQLNKLPWTFFLYLVLIIVLACLGGMYQFLKLRRQDPNEQIQVNFVESMLEQNLDKVKQETIDKIIKTYNERKSQSKQEYIKMEDLNEKKSNSSDPYPKI